MFLNLIPSSYIHEPAHDNFPLPPDFSIDSPTERSVFAAPSQMENTQLLEIWAQLLRKLAELIPQDEFSKWFKPLQVKPLKDRVLLVLIPNMMIYQKIHDSFLEVIERLKMELQIEDLLIQFELESYYLNNITHFDAQKALNEEDLMMGLEGSNLTENPETSGEVYAAQVFPDPGYLSSQNTDAPKLKSLNSGSGQLNPNYTFENFVKGSSNQFAMTTCQAVAKAPGQSYNPLFIFGSTGLGKTHLLHAVGNYILGANPNATVTYVTSERFMNEMVYCLRHKKMWEFRQKFRQCDAILIDDIQFISGKKATQEEFFHTFNTLYAAKKQIVITSDLFPQNIADIEDRLRNRFQWGLIADIQLPDIEHRVAILRRKSNQMGVQIEDEVLEYIAKLKKRDVRELEGALLRLKAYSNFEGQKIGLELAHRTFKDVTGEVPKKISIDYIQKIVADHYRVRVSDLKSKRRQSAVALPRQVAMYLVRKIIGSSFPEIGERFGGKDHTTVMHNVKKIELVLTSDLDLQTTVESLEKQIEQMQ